MRLLTATLLLFISTMTFAQNKVTGTVKDAAGDPLVGVSVVEVGTNNGTATDVDGNYSLVVKNGAQLQFSYVGFTPQTISAGSARSVTLLEDNKTLNEVVVVGYGTMRRKDITSSITTINAKDMNQGVFTTPAELLQGKVPGLVISNTSDPNGSSSISLRGASSLRSGAAMEPYYVIDGIPGVDLSLVAPNDIESIDVLRDATATAIYGSKAANGVIIITTKKGNKSGRTNVSYNGYVGFDNALKTLDMMSANELLSYANANGVDLSPYYDASNPADTNWQDEVLRTAISHNHNVSINGGHNKTSYSASINYMNRQGIVRGTNFDRLNARTYLQTSILKDHLDLAISVNGSIGNFQTAATGTVGQSVMDAMYYYSPLVPVRHADGSWYSNTSISQNYNPLSMINEDEFKGKHKMLQGIGNATLHILEGLDWHLTLSYENRQRINNDYHSTLSQLPDISSRHGQASRSTTENIRKQMETYINWEHTFDKVHKVALMGGYSWEQSDNGDGFGLTVYNFYNDDLKYYNIGLANQMDIDGIISSPLSTLRMISFYGRANYSYNSKYNFQATIRRDGSSAFGKNHRWGTFPSVSAAWRLSEEQFIKNLNVFDDLKLRVGYGVSGNSLGFNAYTALQTFGATGWFTYVNPDGSLLNYRTLNATHNANPDLKWEKTGMFNIGIDFSFFNSRLSGTIEYYDKRTSDLIYGYAVSQNRYPYGTMDANVGDISNKGVELTLNAIPVQTKDFTWSTSFNLSHNSNKVEKISNSTYSVDYIDEANPDVGGFSVNAEVQRIMEGSPIGQFYLWEWAGYNDKGGSVFNDYDEDGKLVGTTDAPDATDRRPHGSAQPKLTFGWNNTLNYRNWSLTAFFQGILGNKIFNGTRAYYNNVTLLNTGKNILSEVATMQKATDTRAQAPSDRYLENGSYLRLASLSLGYTFNNLDGWARSLRLYATCNNLFTITSYKGLDPEVYLGGLTPGIDWRNTGYPRARTFMVGVNINF